MPGAAPRRTLRDHSARQRPTGVPLGEAGPPEQLGAPLQLGAERLGELPHTDGVVGGEVGGDMGNVRAHPQPVTVAFARADAVPAVDQHDAQPVRPFGRGERGDDGPQQLRTPAAGRTLDQQVRSVGAEVRGDRSARPGPEHGTRPPAQGLRVVGRVRPPRHQRRRGGPGQPQLVQQPRGLRQRHGHTRVPLPGGPLRTQRRQRPSEPLRPGEGNGVHGGDGAVADGTVGGGGDGGGGRDGAGPGGAGADRVVAERVVCARAVA